MASSDLELIFELVKIGAILGAGVAVVFKLGRASKAVEASTERFELAIQAQGTRFEDGMRVANERITRLEDAIKILSEVVTKVAVQNQRLDTQDRRLDEHTRIIEDLRRGEGMILPLTEALKGRGRGPA